MIISEKEFETYAELILHLVALEKDDFVLINADMEHKNLVSQVVRLAYEKGAAYVHINIGSDFWDGVRAKHSRKEHLNIFPESIQALYREYSEKRACVISIRSPQDPTINKDIPSDKLGIINKTKNENLMFFREYIMSDKLSWIVVSCPTEGWAKNVYPDIEANKGMCMLWEEMKKILRLNTENPIQAWEEQQQKIISRREYLNKKKYKKLEFNCKDTGFVVGLHERSTWLGAAHDSENGKFFQANLPTEEVYTTPDCRVTKGTVHATRPLTIFGKKVDGISMTFENGKLKEAHAELGNDNLQEFINADERNKYLGEIAIVDTLSPIWQSGLMFNNILYDENAGVHFALGAAYPTGYGYKAGNVPSEEELIAMGCNVGKYHLDFSIGTHDMNIHGINADDSAEAIMIDGRFIETPI